MASSSKLSQSWKHSAPSPLPAKTGFPLPVEDKNDDIQIIEEEEEVLVDDFDGQCCRTYPYNHSKIQRWREEQRRRGEEKRVKESKEARRQEKQLQESGTVKEHHVSCSSIETGVRPSEPITTSAGKYDEAFRGKYSEMLMQIQHKWPSYPNIWPLSAIFVKP